uniref:Uncharacterized protein n=1 Tax=Sinocyclocheilus grahami TaxID=75366 RepID=A0A672S465_SINGR
MAGQTTPTTIVTTQHVSSGTWTTGICDCCSDMSTCKTKTTLVCFRLLCPLVFPLYAVSDCISVWLVFLHAIAGLLHGGILLSASEDERAI